MELRQIRYAVAVAEDRHFGRAAERMFIAQPALSQHVRRLERELDAQLFDRGARHVRLTPAGEAFLSVARHMLRQADEAVTAARRAEAGEIGSVSVGASLALGTPILSHVLRRWVLVRPEVRPMLLTGRNRDLVDRVRRRELDVALVEEVPADTGLQSLQLLDDPLVVLLPVHHPLSGAASVRVADLADEPFVTVSHDGSPTMHDRCIALCSEAGIPTGGGSEVDDPALVPVAVAAGLGVALVPSMLAAATALPGVTSSPLHDEGAHVTVSAVAVRDGATPQARDLLELLGRLRGRHGLSPMPARHLESAPPAPERSAS